MRPFDNVTITANYFRFELKGDYRSNTIKVPEWGYANFFTGATLDPSGTIFSRPSFDLPPDASDSRVPGHLFPLVSPPPHLPLPLFYSVSNPFFFHFFFTIFFLFFLFSFFSP